jgi:hypothetical protein
MIVGFLRQGSLYRAPCRWYPDGPIGEIEYYYAEPDAKWYDGTQIFFPQNFFKGSENTGVGELTDQGPRDFRQQRLTPPCPGQWAVGTVADFNGETPYPGETTLETLPDCEHPPRPLPTGVRVRIGSDEVDEDVIWFYVPEGSNSIGIEFGAAPVPGSESFYALDWRSENADVTVTPIPEEGPIRGWRVVFRMLKDYGENYRFRFTWQVACDITVKYLNLRSVPRVEFWNVEANRYVEQFGMVWQPGKLEIYPAPIPPGE